MFVKIFILTIFQNKNNLNGLKCPKVPLYFPDTKEMNKALHFSPRTIHQPSSPSTWSNTKPTSQKPQNPP